MTSTRHNRWSNTVVSEVPATTGANDFESDVEIDVASLAGLGLGTSNGIATRSIILERIKVEFVPTSTTRSVFFQLQLYGPNWNTGGNTRAAPQHPYKLASKVNPTTSTITAFTPALKNPVLSTNSEHGLVVKFWVGSTTTMNESVGYFRTTSHWRLLPQDILSPTV